MSVTVVKDRVAEILKGIRSLTKDVVLVGIPAEDAAREHAPAAGTLINNAALGYIHENGAPEAGIPPRPFLLPGIAGAQARIADEFGKAATYAIEGRPEAVSRQFVRAGTIGRDAVKAKINTGPFVPLAPTTLAARRARGRTGTKPLIDTGQLRNSINFVVRSR